MAIKNIFTGKDLMPVDDILALYREYTQKAEAISNSDKVKTFTGRYSELAERHIRELQENWARLNSAAIHVGDDHPEVKAYRYRFLIATQPQMAEELMLEVYDTRDQQLIDAVMPLIDETP